MRLCYNWPYASDANINKKVHDKEKLAVSQIVQKDIIILKSELQDRGPARWPQRPWTEPWTT